MTPEFAASDLVRASKTFQLMLSYNPGHEIVVRTLARIQMHVLYFAEGFGVHMTEVAEKSVTLKEEMENQEVPNA